MMELSNCNLCCHIHDVEVHPIPQGMCVLWLHHSCYIYPSDHIEILTAEDSREQLDGIWGDERVSQSIIPCCSQFCGLNTDMQTFFHLVRTVCNTFVI